MQADSDRVSRMTAGRTVLALDPDRHDLCAVARTGMLILPLPAWATAIGTPVASAALPPTGSGRDTDTAPASCTASAPGSAAARPQLRFPMARAVRRRCRS